MRSLSRREVLQFGAAAAAIGALTGSPSVAEEHKSAIEQLVNPFGDAWASRTSVNRSIPVATSSLLRLFKEEPLISYGRFAADGTPLLSPDFVNFHRQSSSPFHYDESIGYLSDDMPHLKPVKAAFRAAGLEKRFIGYTTVNFVAGPTMPGYADADEAFFVHRRGTEPTPQNRVMFQDRGGALNAGGEILDVRNRNFHEFIARKFTSAMVVNDLDALLIDYAVNQIPFGLDLVAQLPEDWADTFFEHQAALLRTISSHAAAAGKMVFCNGVTMDGIYDTEVARVRPLIAACHGAFWEQPFRTEWLERDNGPDEYYERLDAFFNLATDLNRVIIVKQGTYRFHGTEAQNTGWKWRFPLTSAAKERELLDYLLGFYLLYMKGDLTPLIYTHPTEIFDIYTSEAYFREFATDVGAPVGPRRKVADHVHMRVFERAIVVLNNREEAFSGNTLAVDGASEVALVSIPQRSGRIILRG